MANAQASQPMVVFSFPPGHPRHGKTCRCGNFHFVDGACPVPAKEKEKIARTLTRYYGAAEEGTESYQAIAAQYAPKGPSAEELEAAAKAEAEAKAKAEADAAAAAASKGKGK